MLPMQTRALDGLALERHDPHSAARNRDDGARLDSHGDAAAEDRKRY